MYLYSYVVHPYCKNVKDTNMKVIGWFELHNDEDDIVVEYVPYFDMAEWIEEEQNNDRPK